MKKKLLALILALSLSLSLAACGGTPQNGSTGGDTPEASTPESGAPGTSQDGSAGGDAPETSTPESGAPEPTAPGESETQEEIDLAAFYDTLRAENTWPELMDVVGDPTLQEMLDSFYPGLSDIPTKQCGVYVAAISAAVGEIALVEVENAEDVQAVKDIFQARIDYQVGDENNPGGAWYPETIEGWKDKSQIVSNGNYVMLAVGNPAEDAVERFDALFA